jgi:AraC-like DNA-binding protein
MIDGRHTRVIERGLRQLASGEQVMPQSAVFRFSDADQYQASIRGVSAQVRLTARGHFDAELTRIELDRLQMQRSSLNLARIAHVANYPKRAPILFLSDANQGAMRHSGLEVPPGELVFFREGSTDRHQTEGPCRWAAMWLTPEDLTAAGQAIAGCELAMPKATHVLRPAREAMMRLMTLHEAVCNLAKTNPGHLAKPATAKALEQELVRTMVVCLTGHQLADVRWQPQQHIRIITRFEEYLAKRKFEPVYLAEMCSAIGVSERTLRACCHEHFGIGPIRYLWLRRMHLVRRALERADPANSNVTTLAADHGFWELGRFSVEYRALFGESPRDVLRRPSAHSLH